MALAINGTAAIGENSTGTSTSLVSGTFTTSVTNCVIVAVCFLENNARSAAPPHLNTVKSTSGGANFTLRKAFTDSTKFNQLEVWWLASASTFSDTVTATQSASCDDAQIIVFAVSGANTSAPWDSNASLPATAQGTATSTPTVTGVSTSTANAMLLGMCGIDTAGTTETAGTGYTLVKAYTGGNFGIASAVQQKIVSATQSSVSVAFGKSVTSGNWDMIADAIIAAGAAAAPTWGWGQQSDRERPLTAITRLADQATPWFQPPQAPVAPPQWQPLTGQEDRLSAQIKRPSDEAPPYFRSGASFLPTWLPQMDGWERPKPVNAVLDGASFVRFPVAGSVPISGIAWYNWQDKEGRQSVRRPEDVAPFFRSPSSFLRTWFPQLSGDLPLRPVTPDLTGSAFVRFPGSATVPPSGIPWYNFADAGHRPTPFIPRPGNKFFSVSIAATPMPIGGMAWYNWQDREEPAAVRRSEDVAQFFRPRSSFPPTWLPQSSIDITPKVAAPDLAGNAFVRFPGAAAVPISGMAWYNWQDKEARPPIIRDLSGKAFVRFPVTAAVPISGMAWYNPGSDTGQRPTPFVPRPGNKFFSVQISSAVPIGGMAWYSPGADTGERPTPFMPRPGNKFFSVQVTNTSVPISGIPWMKQPDERIIPVIGDPYVVQAIPPFIEPPLLPFYAAANADDFNPLRALEYEEHSTFVLRPPPPPVGISGMAWWRPSDIYREPAPAYRDYHPTWLPIVAGQFRVFWAIPLNKTTGGSSS